jgi:hypothetical protein
MHIETEPLGIRLPKKLKKDFQVACLKNDTDMTKEIRKFMEEYVKK